MHHLLIDTDPGVDDALAILLAHAHPEAKVAALTIAAGNVGLGHTVSNALKLLDVIGADTPVYAGAPQPLVLPAEDAAYVHGMDGFGDTGYRPSARRPEREHAVDAMLRLSRERPGELTFVMLGPLTNLALALSLDPELPQRVKRLVIMGGAVTGVGNTRLPAEFNVYFDPEAAYIVMSRWPNFELSDWEATVRHGFAFETFESWLGDGNPRAAFYDAISRKTRAWSRNTAKRPLWMAADALAMAVVLEPENVTEWAEHALHVELAGSHCRGMTVVDWANRDPGPKRAKIALRFRQERFERLLAYALGASTL